MTYKGRRMDAAAPRDMVATRAAEILPSWATSAPNRPRRCASAGCALLVVIHVGRDELVEILGKAGHTVPDVDYLCINCLYSVLRDRPLQGSQGHLAVEVHPPFLEEGLDFGAEQESRARNCSREINVCGLFVAPDAVQVERRAKLVIGAKSFVEQIEKKLLPRRLPLLVRGPRLLAREMPGDTHCDDRRDDRGKRTGEVFHHRIDHQAHPGHRQSMT